MSWKRNDYGNLVYRPPGTDLIATVFEREGGYSWSLRSDSGLEYGPYLIPSEADAISAVTVAIQTRTAPRVPAHTAAIITVAHSHGITSRKGWEVLAASVAHHWYPPKEAEAKSVPPARKVPPRTQPAGLVVRVAGVTHNPGSSSAEVGDECRLVPEPDNRYDTGAVRVELVKNGQTIGYIPAEETANVRKLIESEWETSVYFTQRISGGKVIKVLIEEGDIIERLIAQLTDSDD